MHGRKKVCFEGSLGHVIVALTAESQSQDVTLMNTLRKIQIIIVLASTKITRPTANSHPTTMILTRHFKILGISQGIKIAIFGWKAFFISMQNYLVTFSPTYLSLCNS